MKNKSQLRERNGRAVTLKDNRIFLMLLAGATLVIAGVALSVILTGKALAPSHFSAAPGPQTGLQLAHVQPALQSGSGTALQQQTPDALTVGNVPDKITSRAPAEAALQTEAPLTVPTAIAGQSADAARTEEVSARKAAKKALAEKLARLQLARALPAARRLREEVPASGTDTARIALTEGPEAVASPPLVVASLPDAIGSLPGAADPGPGSDTDTAANTLLAPDPDRPAKPGAILPPSPASKPAIAQRSAPADAGQDNTGTVRPAKPVLAYAAPGIPEEEEEKGIFGRLFNGSRGGLPGRGSGIAVYDISAAVVHMPDGTKLEAHSGIGHRKDNPKYAYVKNLGPTPPNVYDLRMRERRFHGVEAIRMLPRDRAAMKGRDGMLTHTPLLRSSNGSHGCVAFKNYAKFLKAFKAGKVTKLIVVPTMEKLPTYMAKLNRSSGA